MNPYTNGGSIAQREQTWELQEASHYAQYPQYQGEWETENEYFSQKMLGDIHKVAKASAPIAKQIAPIAARLLAGSRSTPRSELMTASLLDSLLQDGAQSAIAMEAKMFGSSATEAEVSNTEAAYEAALAEVLAAEASHSHSESEAEAFLGAAIPSIVASMGGRRNLHAVIPTLVRANALLVRLLHQKGITGRRLIRLIPTILRRTIASLEKAHRAGHPVNSEWVLRLMSNHVSQVFGNSNAVTSGIIRNAVIQKQTIR